MSSTLKLARHGWSAAAPYGSGVPAAVRSDEPDALGRYVDFGGKFKIGDAPLPQNGDAKKAIDLAILPTPVAVILTGETDKLRNHVAMVALKSDPAKTLSDRVLALLERVSYRRADRVEEREAIFRLRYDAYLREGAISPSASRRFCDALDDATNAWIFGLYIDGELASSIRLHVAHRKWHALPALDVFSDLLSPEIAVGRTIVDPTRFVIDRIASRRYPELCYVTTRLAVLASEYFSVDLLLATVRAEHQAFYRRVFGHRLACKPRQYPSLSKPICLMALDYPLARERLLQRQPFFRSTALERQTLFGRAPVAFLQSAV